MEMNPLEQYPHHKKILTNLFERVDTEKEYTILDAGSGKTSLYFLTTHFPHSVISAIVYPGDTRKIESIRRHVHASNFSLRELDIQELEPERSFDIVLAHLLLGEAAKFGGNTFENVLHALFKIRTRYLVIVDVLDDPEVKYGMLLRSIAETGTAEHVVSVEKYVGFLILKER